jgi:Leucine-rich repeat (LRR) protein
MSAASASASVSAASPVEDSAEPTMYVIYKNVVGDETKHFLRYFKNWSEILEDPMLHEKAVILHCNDANLVEIPEEISRFRALKELNCMNNNLVFLPETLAELENLEELYITNNKLMILPDEIGKLKKLHRIDAAYNMLDTLPESFAELEGLRFLNFVHNNFKQIPRPLTRLSTLEKLFINHNYIKTVPEEIAGMTALQILNLSANRIWKTLPAGLGTLGNLEILYLENNCIQALPEDIGGWTRLKELHLQENQISVMPPTIGRCTALATLNISSNAFSTLPMELTQCARLEDFQREDNELDIPAPIERFLNRNLRRNTRNYGAVYRDGQNVHASSIQASIKDSLLHLMNDPYSATKDEVVAAIIESHHVQKKEILIGYINDDRETHSTLYCTFFEAFMKVWGRIVNCTDEERRGELFKRLNEELAEGECMCFTGRLSRLVNVLNGFYDDIRIEISTNEQIANVILVLRQQHGLKSEDDMTDAVKEAIRKELEERGYEADIIEVWLNV